MTEKCIAFLAMVCSGIGYTVYVVNRYISIEEEKYRKRIVPSVLERLIVSNEVDQQEKFFTIR